MRRLRDWSSVQVSTRSPMPARPMKVCGSRAERDAEARHLHQAARDQRNAGVGAEAQAVGDAGADRQHVLHRAADFHADDVARGVGAEVVAGQALRQLRAHSPASVAATVMAVGRPMPTSLRESRPGQHRQRRGRAQHFARHLVGQLAGLELETLGGPRHARVRAQQRLHVREHLAQGVARHRHDHDGEAASTALQVAVGVQGIREVGAGQVARVFARALAARPDRPRPGPRAVSGDRRARTGSPAPCPRSRRRPRRWLPPTRCRSWPRASGWLRVMRRRRCPRPAPPAGGGRPRRRWPRSSSAAAAGPGNRPCW